jgi:hypothetical protein
MHAFLFLAAIAITTDFEGGSANRIEKVSDTHFRIAIHGQTDQNKRNRQATWYYFRVDNAGSDPLTFDIVDLPGEYNFKPNRGAITSATPPVISNDGGKTWRHVTGAEYDEKEPHLRLRIKPSSPTFFIAHTPPYTNQHLIVLRDVVRKRGAREEIIGRSVGGRDLYLWTVGDGPKTAWLMFRQHAWESGSSWVGDSAVRALLEDSKGITWKILPFADPDGVAKGGVRFNANGYDLNRNWDAIDPKLMPEIAAQHRAIAEWVKRGRTVDFFLSVHNTETAEYLQGPPGPPLPVGTKLFDILVRDTTFHPSRPMGRSEATTTQGMKGRMTVVQGLWKDFQIPAYLMEQRVAYNQKLGRLPLIEDRVAFGKQLVNAIAAALR